MKNSWIIVVVAALAIFAASTWARMRNYRECRAHGLSQLYCTTALR